MISEKIIKEATKRLVETFQPQRIILFGSSARGTADEYSDIDLLVICPFQKNRVRLMGEMDRVLEGLNLPRDIVILTPEEFEIEKEMPGTIARCAWKEGRLLYAKKERHPHKEGKRVGIAGR